MNTWSTVKQIKAQAPAVHAEALLPDLWTDAKPPASNYTSLPRLAPEAVSTGLTISRGWGGCCRLSPAAAGNHAYSSLGEHQEAALCRLQGISANAAGWPTASGTSSLSCCLSIFFQTMLWEGVACPCWGPPLHALAPFFSVSQKNSSTRAV